MLPQQNKINDLRPGLFLYDNWINAEMVSALGIQFNSRKGFKTNINVSGSTSLQRFLELVSIMFYVMHVLTNVTPMSSILTK